LGAGRDQAAVSLGRDWKAQGISSEMRLIGWRSALSALSCFGVACRLQSAFRRKSERGASARRRESRLGALRTDAVRAKAPISCRAGAMLLCAGADCCAAAHRLPMALPAARRFSAAFS